MVSGWLPLNELVLQESWVSGAVGGGFCNLIPPRWKEPAQPLKLPSFTVSYGTSFLESTYLVASRAEEWTQSYMVAAQHKVL